LIFDQLPAAYFTVNEIFLPVMKRRQRLKHLLELLATREELSVDEACEWLAASPATIRRAFAELAQSGQVDKTWGGIRLASAPAAPLAPPAFAKRLANQADEKRAIARAAAALIHEDDVVMIDGGTTTYRLAEFLAGKRIRVITNSLVIANAIDQFQGSRRGAEVLLCGGTLQPESGIVAGPAAESFLKRYQADWLLLGCAGIDTEHVTNFEEAVLASERLMIERSSRIALLADQTKLGRTAMCTLCPVRRLDHLFTGESAEQSGLLRKIERGGVTVTRAKAVQPKG
jgi:DeoR family transcriptional regulator, ulaG and ulaABCDEF operon transcriptional repressor